MKKFAWACTALVAAAVALPLGAASEKIDYEAINKIKQQGLNPQTSQVMEISSWLTDVHGPRLTGSPNVQKAGEWAAAKMKEWKVVNAPTQSFSYVNQYKDGSFTCTCRCATTTARPHVTTHTCMANRRDPHGRSPKRSATAATTSPGLRARATSLGR